MEPLWRPTLRACALCVGLPDVTVLAVDAQPGEPIGVHVEQRVDRPRCAGCSAAAWVKDRPVMVAARRNSNRRSGPGQHFGMLISYQVESRLRS
jgi:hypothetical protein